MYTTVNSVVSTCPIKLRKSSNLFESVFLRKKNEKKLYNNNGSWIKFLSNF